MDEILEILVKDARITPEEIARMTGRDLSGVKKDIRRYETDGTIVRYKAVVDPERVREGQPLVRALIEVSVTPQKGMGFDHIAERIYSFPEVVSCYLVSGSFDLLVIVEGENLQTVSDFIASKLAPLEHVRSTTTHFLLKKYKEDGHIFKKSKNRKRLAISY